MILIFGTRGRITTSNERDRLAKACPNCKSDLELKELKKWFTLFFIPVFPFSTLDTFYQCNGCESSYKKSARQALLGATADAKEVQQEAKRLFGLTLVACMTHMANIDGEISRDEIEEINKVKETFAEFSQEIEEMSDKVINAEQPGETVYALLRNASQVLTSKAIMHVIGLSARVLLADGRIDKEEENLMKEYLLVCGIPKDMYATIIEKVK